MQISMSMAFKWKASFTEFALNKCVQQEMKRRKKSQPKTFANWGTNTWQINLKDKEWKGSFIDKIFDGFYFWNGLVENTIVSNL